MNIDNLTKLLEVLLSWPVIILLIVIFLGAALKNFISNVHQVNVKTPVFEGSASVERLQKEAAGYLGAALTTTSGETTIDGQIISESQASIGEVKGIAKAVSQEITPESIQQLSGASVLWVDDHPATTFYKRKALELLGIHFTLSTSTADALEKVSTHKYDVIISDMEHPFDEWYGSSPPGSWAASSPPNEWYGTSPPGSWAASSPADEWYGTSPPDSWAASSPADEWYGSRLIDKQGAYTLLDELQKRNIHTPFIIHSSSSPEKKAEARRRGAFGFTGNPETLFRMVIDAV